MLFNDHNRVRCLFYLMNNWSKKNCYPKASPERPNVLRTGSMLCHISSNFSSHGHSQSARPDLRLLLTRTTVMSTRISCQGASPVSFETTPLTPAPWLENPAVPNWNSSSTRRSLSKSGECWWSGSSVLKSALLWASRVYIYSIKIYFMNEV